jgi:ABC-type lipoprotein export system ATPase subunit
MNKMMKTNYLIEGMIETFKKKKSSRLFNEIVGLVFKNLRLEKNITAEAVVQDNKIYFGSIYDLYKFEKGIKTDVSKLNALQSYYKYDVKNLFDRLN